MRHFQTHHIGLSFITFLLCGCTPLNYRANKHFTEEKWIRKEPIFFNFTPHRTGSYQPTIWLRHSTNYLYRDFHCLLTVSQGHLAISVDTLHLMTTNAKGNWIGQGLQGLKTLSCPLPHTIRLDSACHYQITIQHLMEDDTLQAVRDAGILLEPQSQNH